MSSSAFLHLANLDLEKSFQLISLLVSLEACKRHGLLPLNLSDACLEVGMIFPEDQEGLTYLKSLVEPLNYRLSVKALDQKTYHLILSAYLNYQQNQQSPLKEESSQRISGTSDLSGDREPFGNEKATFITDNPEQERSAFPPRREARPVVRAEIRSYHPELSLGELRSLPSPLFLSEILVRIIQQGVGRVYLEWKEGYGEITLTVNGLILGSIRDLTEGQYKDLMQTLKRISHLSPGSVTKLHKVELEQYFQNIRVLLRIQVSPQGTQETANIQILHGKALTFYQQKQMDEMGIEALQAAQHLERKLRQIYARKQINPTELKVLRELQGIGDRLNQQLYLLKQIELHQPPGQF